MLANSKKVLALALAAFFLFTPLVSTAAAAAPDLAAPMQLELRSGPHGSPPGHNRGPSHSVGRGPGHRGPSHGVRHAPGPRYARHDSGRHYGHRQPPPPPPRDGHHHHHCNGNDKLIGGLIAGVVIGAVIANNT